MSDSRTRTRGIVALVVMLVVVAFAGLVVAGSSPSTCGRCHGDVVKATTHSKHAQVGCYSCHAPGAARVGFKAEELLRMYPLALLGRSPKGPVREIPRSACLSCHDAVLKIASPGTITGIRIAHETCAPEASCDSCHATTAHGARVRWQRGPVMERCVACHRTSGASTDCATCHEGRVKGDRLKTGPWQVTHGAGWKKTHGMGDLESCSTCHPEDYCARCHKVSVPHDAAFGSEHGVAAVSDLPSCLQCHRTERFCDACHGTKMPHPAGFLQRHSAEAKTIENLACQRCHAVEDCNICHRRHVHPGNARASAGLGVPSVPGGSK